jgi:hypothetical protein
MDIRESNMLCLKEHREKMFEAIQKIETSGLSSGIEQIYSIQTGDMDQALVIQCADEVYRLNSIYSPRREAKYWADQFHFGNIENVIIMFGLGNGVFVKEIINRMGKSGILFIYEPSREAFLHVIENYDLTDVLENHHVVLAVEDVNSFDFRHYLISSINLNNLRCQIICAHPYYDIIFKDSYLEFWKEIRDINKHAQLNINTAIAFGKRMIENTLKNSKYLSYSNTIQELQTIVPQDLPAIVVSAGPSVRNEIENLKRAKGKAIIIAVDRILDYLLDEGVEPDLVATIDPKKPVQYFSRRTDVTIPLLSFIESNHEIFDAHKGRKIICNCASFLSEVYIRSEKEVPKMITGSSVATTAFAACLELGLKNIILVGQDLAYDGGLSHAGSINEGEETWRDTYVEGMDGTMIRSRTDWKEFVLWFQDVIKIYPELNVIDVKQKGARIKGAAVMTLKEAIDQYGKKDGEYHLDIEDLKVDMTLDMNKCMTNYFSESIQDLTRIMDRTKNALKICDALIKECNRNIVTTKTEEYHKKLNKAINHIVKQPIYYLIDVYISAMSAQDLSEIYGFSKDAQENTMNTYLKSRKIFESVLEAAEFIKPNIEESLKVLSE